MENPSAPSSSFSAFVQQAHHLLTRGLADPVAFAVVHALPRAVASLVVLAQFAVALPYPLSLGRYSFGQRQHLDLSTSTFASAVVCRAHQVQTAWMPNVRLLARLALSFALVALSLVVVR